MPPDISLNLGGLFGIRITSRFFEPRENVELEVFGHMSVT